VFVKDLAYKFAVQNWKKQMLERIIVGSFSSHINLK